MAAAASADGAGAAAGPLEEAAAGPAAEAFEGRLGRGRYGAVFVRCSRDERTEPWGDGGGLGGGRDEGGGN